MQRVSASSGEPDTRAGQRPESVRPRREASAVPTAIEPIQPAAPAIPRSEEPEPAQARSRTPPKHIDLSVFREVANMSARHAIQQHSRRTLVRAMYSKLTVMLVALVASVGLFWIWRQFGACKLTLYSSLTAIGVAIFWGLEYALLTDWLIIHKGGRVNIDWKGSSHRGAGAVSPAADDAAEIFDRRNRRQPCEALVAGDFSRAVQEERGWGEGNSRLLFARAISAPALLFLVLSPGGNCLRPPNRR